MKTEYTDRAERFGNEKKKLAGRLSVTSFVRLLLFLLFAWFLYKAFKNKFEGFDLPVALICVGLFIVVVFMAASVRKQIQFLEQLIKVNENEDLVAEGVPSFLDNGALLSPGWGFAADLNVFGRHSLFHLLNRTGSHSGKKQLAARLASPFGESAPILNYQGCAKELSGKIDFRQSLLAQTLLFKEEETLAQLQAGIRVEDFAVLRKAPWNILAFLWPALGIAVIGAGFLLDSYAVVFAFTIIGLLLLGFVLKKINLLYFHISRRSYLYNQYARCFDFISKQDFAHPYLKKKQDEIKHASKAFDSLARVTGVFDLRLSMLTFFANGLFLSDLSCARAYLAWNEEYQSDINTWFAALGEMELLNSIGSFHATHPDFVFPSVVDEGLLINAAEMGHPLMKPSLAVVNDVSIGEKNKLHLITGSNMSGKSTFLRTLGLNVLLGQLGAPVFAKSFSFRPVRLLTSFHHIDSLEESTSYFYAELKCLKDIISSLDKSAPALVLLDEVMRGTNSKDKHDGTALLIRKLLSYQCLSLIATHDTELGVLASAHPGMIANFCFESRLENDELIFDFKMREGVATTKNATYLMQKMGILGDAGEELKLKVNS